MVGPEVYEKVAGPEVYEKVAGPEVYEKVGEKAEKQFND